MLNWIFILLAPIYLILFVLCIYKNLVIASSIIEAGCDAFGDLPSALLVPIFSLVLIILNASLWIYICMAELSTNVEAPTNGYFMPNVIIYTEQRWVVALALFNLIYWIIFWGTFGDFVLISMFTNW